MNITYQPLNLKLAELMITFVVFTKEEKLDYPALKQYFVRAVHILQSKRQNASLIKHLSIFLTRIAIVIRINFFFQLSLL